MPKYLINIIFRLAVFLFCITTFTVNSLFGGPNAYIGHAAGNVIDVVDTATNTVLMPITVGMAPEFNAVSSDGTRVYVANTGDGTVSVIDTTTVPNPTVIQTIPVGTTPQYIVISSDDSTVYVCNNGSASVTYIDTTTFATGTIATGNNPTFVSLSSTQPIGTISSRGNSPMDPGNVIVFSTGIGKPILATLTTNIINPIEALIIPDGTKAYVSNNGAASVAVIDLLSPGYPTSLITTNIGTAPASITYSSDGTILAIGNQASNSFSIIDVATDTAQEFFLMPSNSPFAIYFAPGEHTAFISSFATSFLYVFDADSNTFLPTIPTPLAPSYMAFTPDQTTLYVASFGSSILTAVDLTTPGFPTTSLPMSTMGSIWIGMQSPMLTPNPPTNLQGAKIKNEFLLQTSLINVLTWAAPSGTLPTSYRIYRDAGLTNLIGEVFSPGPLTFSDYNVGKHETITYYVVSISSSGVASTPATTTIAR